ncbi:MAG: SGNH/GDSL hydrolase family protein [Cyclobacteriaceae bacterium]|nr:SGNH/GDSL hydrolase family protein [Cyclobacteriaceae bacterium]
MIKAQRIYLYVLIWIGSNSIVGCHAQEQSRIEKDSTLHILFVGNSLTYTNNLPELVSKEARTQRINLITEMLAFPNYALEDHWQDRELQRRIMNGKFDFVIVQQGPSSQSDGREMLLDFGARIKNLCDQHDSKLVFFMVWPARTNWNTFPGVIRNYTEAAMATKSILCPVGSEWKQYIESTADYSYYGPDQFHPSLKGSQNAAAMIFKVLLENP